MSNFNVMGSYSGIDMSVIDQMIEAEKAKGIKFTNQKDKIEREQGAWKDVGTRLNSLTQKIDALNKRSTFESRNVTSTAGDNSSVSVSAGNSAPIGNYQVKVDQLATSTRLVGASTIDFTKGDLDKASIDRKLELTGTFKFRNGDGKLFEVQVKSDDSLRRITQNINSQTKESGIEASVINNRLILKDTKMGKRDVAVEVSGPATGLGFTTSANRLTGNQVDPDSIKNLFGEFKFGDGEQFKISIDQTDTLEKIKDKINDTNTGVTASVMDGRLVLTDKEGNINIKDNDVSKKLGFYENTTITGNNISEDLDLSQLAGKFTIKDGAGNQFEIDISGSKNLEDIANKISDASYTDENGEKTNINLTATLSKDGKQLILTGNNTGNIEILDDNNIAQKLGLSAGEHLPAKIEAQRMSSAITLGEESNIGQGSIFTIDGIKVERNTNRISDAIEGIAFTLKSEGASEVISITNNTQKGVDAMKEFVDQYNSVMNFIQTQTDVGSPGEDNNTVGALVGEGSIMRLQSGLRSTLMQRINGKSIADFGVEIDRYGVASLDESKLNKALQEDPTSLSRFFYRPDLDLGAAEGTEESRNKSEETKGMSELFKNFLDTYTARSKGIISTKQQSYDRIIKNINEQIETFNERIDRKRARYIQQFSALDTAMMRAESQLEYLYSQIGLDQK